MEIKNLWIPSGVKKSLLALSLTLVVGVFLYKEFNKKSDCEIKDKHIHKYTKEDSLDRYIESELLRYYDYSWSGDFILVDQEEADLRNFEAKNDLYRISENKDFIENIERINEDHLEYEYTTIYMMPVAHSRKIGNTTSIYYTYIPIISRPWTTDKNHSSLTGYQQLIHYVYEGYKIEKDEKGKLVVIPSPQVDSVSELPEDYQYVKRNFAIKTVVEKGYNLDPKYQKILH